MLDGDVIGAFLVNPLAALAGLVFVVGGVLALPWSILRWPIPSCGFRWSRKWTIAVIAIAAANWVYLVATL